MSYGHLDDKSAFHAKVLAVGNAAWGAFCRMIAYANDHLTDGWIDERTARLIASPTEIKRLLEVAPGRESPLLYREDGGYRLHDYLDWNLSAEQVRARRAEVSVKRAEAGKLGGIRSGEARRAKQEAKQTRSKDEASCFAVASVLLEAKTKQNEALSSPLLSEREKIPPQTTSGTPPSGPDEAKPAPKPAKDRKGTRISADWTPSAEVLAAFAAQGIDALRAVPEFVDFWLSAAGAYASKRDWNAAFRNQIRRMVEQGRAPRMGGSSAAPADRAPNGRPWIQRPPTAAPPSGPREMPPETWPDEDPDDGPPSAVAGPPSDDRGVAATTPATETQTALFGAPRRSA